MWDNIFDKLLNSVDKAVDIKSKYEAAKQSLKIDTAALDFVTQRYTPTYNTQPGVVPADPTWYMTQAEPQNMAVNAKQQPVYVQESGGGDMLLLLAAAGLFIVLMK